MTAYVLTETAEDELREILSFVARRDGLGRAEQMLDRFLDAFDLLVASPGIGFQRVQLTGDAIRWWPLFRYLVLYDPTLTPLAVIRILHSARDLERVFLPGNPTDEPPR